MGAMARLLMADDAEPDELVHVLTVVAPSPRRPVAPSRRAGKQHGAA